ncbi:hypothetical protein C942_02721 [Photobacterium marinum]|uniref:HEAT repeat domain-containing protein n=1 Tax=Photobacterium marinum TaxID=1056511 RepID=L8JG27_9GAMM|nr:hypothetical protein [Photobacterium marinum]ELR67213.1 hypothetical protein C942_02721 [Photobacterium marinum]
MESKQAVSLMQTLLVNLLQQRQWSAAAPIAKWLSVNGDEAACALCPQIYNHLSLFDEALQALAMVPINMRRQPVVRRAEAVTLFELGYPQLAKEVLLSAVSGDYRELAA